MGQALNSSKQIKLGAIFSYILIIVNAVYGIFIAPYILNSLGSSSYGVYKSIASFSSALMVLDFGIGGTIMRYIAKYNAEKKNEKISPFISMALIETAILIVIVALISVALLFNLNNIFGAEFTDGEMSLAKTLFVILISSMLVQILENLFNGIISGYNNFIFANGVKLGRIILRIVLTVTLLISIKSAVVLALIDLCLTFLILVIDIIFIKAKYKLKFFVKFKNIEWSVFKESFVYTFLLFLTSIAAQINGNLDNVVIGAIRGADLVTIYSFGLVIFAMFEQLSTSISSIMLPTVTVALKSEDGQNNVQNLIAKVGRIQFMLLGAATVGFAILGKQFISLWLGAGFEDVYVIVLILMIPSTFELCVNVCLSVLRAKNLLGFRTIILSLSTVLNLVITIIGVKYWSYIAAAIGTASSFVIGSLIIMNIYYCKKLKFNMLKIYGKIVSRTWLCLLISGAVTYVCSIFIDFGWLAFIINVVIFLICYLTTLLLFGFTKDEKKNIPIIKKFINKREEKINND